MTGRVALVRHSEYRMPAFAVASALRVGVFTASHPHVCLPPRRVAAAPPRRQLHHRSVLAIDSDGLPTTGRVPVAPALKTPASSLPKDAAMYEFEVDAAGYEVMMDGGRASDAIVDVVRRGVQDVIVVCHGWATTRSEELKYVVFNNNLAAALLANDPRKGEEGRSVLVVGVVWPSHPLTALAALKGGKIADSKNYAALVQQANDLRDERPAEYWATVQAELGKTDPKAASKLGEIIDEASDDVLATIDEEPLSLDVLPQKLRAKFTEFAHLLSPEAEEPGAKSEIDVLGNETTAVLVEAGKDLLENSSIGGLLRPLSVVRGIFDQGFLTLRSIRDLARPVLSLFGIFPSARLIAGGKVVSRVLERIIFGQFQRRASNVGSRGVHVLLSQMMHAAGKNGTRFHLVGHSLGAHVVSSAAIGRAPSGSLLPHKLHSVTMLQAAVPVTYYQVGGPYRPLSSQLVPVAGPVVATTSQTDMALYNLEIFQDEVVGRQGFSGLGSASAEVVLRNSVSDALGFKKGMFYTMKADAVIDERSGIAFVDLDGSHSDMFDAPLQARIWEAMNAGGITDADLAIKSELDLPPGYWGEDYTVRRNS